MSLFLDQAIAQWPKWFDPYRSRPLYELPQPANWIKLTPETQPPLAKEVAMPVNDDKLTALERELRREIQWLRGEVMALSGKLHEVQGVVEELSNRDREREAAIIVFQGND